MNTLILYDSTFGHTGHIALIIAGRLGEYGTVKLFRIHEAGLPPMEQMDLVILGCPTHEQGLSAAMHAFLAQLPPGTFQHRSAAAFDTRYDRFVQPSGQASSHIAEQLRLDGATLLVPPKSFFVLEQEGPLEEKEVRDATHWAESMFQIFEAQQMAAQKA